MASYSKTDTLAEKGGYDIQPWGKPPPKKPVFKLQAWMSTLDDDIPISDLSIPGTHDSAAYTSTWPFISTQNLDIKSQLYAGIRYFDFRCGIVQDELQMVHGRATLGLPLSQVLGIMYDYLDQHPREGLVVQLKQDRKSDNSTRSFSEVVIDTLAANEKYWRTDCTTPTLGDIRGRIQLLRRFSGEKLYSYGINVTRWLDNSEIPFTIRTWYGVHITIQDHYSFSSPESLPNVVLKKGGDVAIMLDLAIRDPDPKHWYINFSSAFEFNLYEQINPRQIALGGYHYFRWVDGINIQLYNTLQSLARDRRRRLGVVIMDFPELPEKNLIQCIVDSNFAGPDEVTRVTKRRQPIGTLILLWMLLLLTLGTLIVMITQQAGVNISVFGCM